MPVLLPNRLVATLSLLLMTAAPAGAQTAEPAAAPAADAAATAPAAAVTAITPMSVESVQPALAAAPQLLDTAGALTGTLPVKGKRLYVAEYKLMFEVSGNVRASTRAGYLPGTHYGATSVNVAYAGQPDIAALQAIADRAWADLQQRLAAAGLALEPAEALLREHGPAVYEASQAASTPAAPVYEEISTGAGKRRYLVLAPTGMKLVPRGFAGMGAGNIGQRIAWSKAGVEALSLVPVINVAAQESSGNNRSSIFNRGSTANARAQLEVAAHGLAAHTHANMQGLTLARPLLPPGEFAALREAGGYDTQREPALAALNVLGRMAGIAANNSKKVELAMDFDGPATARLALQGLASFNEAVVQALPR